MISGSDKLRSLSLSIHMRAVIAALLSADNSWRVLIAKMAFVLSTLLSLDSTIAAVLCLHQGTLTESYL
jgi:hypothetical protein